MTCRQLSHYLVLDMKERQIGIMVLSTKTFFVHSSLLVNLIDFSCLISPSLRLLILLQRRKKYKTRTILGYKTLAEGVIRMDAVLQNSRMDMTVELSDTSKSGRPGFPIATIRATQVSSSPVDQDNKNNNSVLISGKVITEWFRLLITEKHS